MSIGLTTALVLGGIGVAGGIAQGVIGSNAASDAAGQQTAAGQQALKVAQDNTNQGIQTVTDATGKANDLLSGGLTADQGMLGNAQTADQGMLGGYQGVGAQGMAGLQNLLSNPNSLIQNDPGYRFRLDQGLQGIQQSAAAGGGLLSGGTLKALTQYGQNYASGEFNNAVNRYGQMIGVGQNAANTGVNAQNQLTGMGLNSQNLITGAQAGNLTNSANSQLQALLQSAQMQGTDITGIGNAQAAGTVGSANAWSQGIGGITNMAGQMATLGALTNNGNGTNASNSTLAQQYLRGW